MNRMTINEMTWMAGISRMTGMTRTTGMTKMNRMTWFTGIERFSLDCRKGLVLVLVLLRPLVG